MFLYHSSQLLICSSLVFQKIRWLSKDLQQHYSENKKFSITKFLFPNILIEMNDLREMNEIDLSTQFFSTKENFTLRLHNVTYPEIN